MNGVVDSGIFTGTLCRAYVSSGLEWSKIGRSSICWSSMIHLRTSLVSISNVGPGTPSTRCSIGTPKISFYLGRFVHCWFIGLHGCSAKVIYFEKVFKLFLKVQVCYIWSVQCRCESIKVPVETLSCAESVLHTHCTRCGVLLLHSFFVHPGKLELLLHWEGDPLRTPGQGCGGAEDCFLHGWLAWLPVREILLHLVTWGRAFCSL